MIHLACLTAVLTWNHMPPQGACGSEPAKHFAVASWYDQGRLTANGERFKPDGLTFAHKTMAFGTRVRFRLRGRSVVARLNDRGPFIKGRTFDLSRGAARSIGLKGVERVQWEFINAN